MNGQISLGHGAFMALGGYVVAVLAHSAGLPYWVGDPIAAAVACGAFGLLFGLIALRLAGVYLALATFSLAVATPSFLKHYKSITGGFGGMSLEPVQAPAGIPLDGAALAVLRDVGGRRRRVRSSRRCSCAASSGARCARCATTRSPPCRSASTRISTRRWRSGGARCWPGIAGGFYAIPTAYVSPDTFSFALSITLLIGAVLGGISTFWGALVGGIVVEFLPLVAQQINAAAPSVVYGVALILVMMFLPDGIVGGLLRLVAAGSVAAPPQPAHESSIPPAAPVAVSPPSRE